METTLDNKFFDFEKAKVQMLTLDQLERTYKENDVYGQPLKGIYHFALLQTILRYCQEAGYTADVWDLFAAQNKDKNSPGVVLLPQAEAQYGEKAVEAHILRRVYANIRLTDFDDDEHTTALAVAFHQNGIQVGFGNNVIICHNQCMLGRGQYVATYGDKGKGRGVGKTVPEILDAVKSWLFDARRIIISEREKIAQMEEIDVSADQMLRLIGLLTALRVKSDTSHKEIREYKTYPLNQSQITKLTEQMLLTYHINQRISVWDIYNCATEMYKATCMDIPQLMPQNCSMVQFLDEQFALPVLN